MRFFWHMWVAVRSLIVSACVALAIALPANAQNAQSSTHSLSGEFSAGGESSSNGLRGLGAISNGQAAVQVAEAVYNFGTVPKGETVKHIFKLRNVGTAPLIIGGVQTSCGCTAAAPSKSNVAPGEESDIAVSFDTRSDRGAATRTIAVFTNDPKNQQLKLTMKGDVKPQVEASPAPVAFGTVKRGTEQSRRVVITDLANGKDFRVGSIGNSSPHIKVTREPRDDGKRGAVVVIILLKTMPTGTFSDIVKVSTSRAPVDISVFGNVVGDLAAAPPQISFGIVPHNASAMRIVRLTNSGGRTVKVIGLSSTSSNVTATVEPVRPGKEYKITVQLRPNTPDGALRGTLAIKTDDPEQETLQVPFYGIIGSFKG